MTDRVKCESTVSGVIMMRGVLLNELLADMIDLECSLSRVIGHLRIMCRGEEE